MTSQVMDVRDTRAFHRLIDLSKSKHAGVIDAATVDWWMMQSEAARKALFGQPKETYQTLGVALTEFVAWCKAMQVEQVWSNGPLFDERIVREAPCPVLTIRKR